MTEDGRGQPTVVDLAGCRCPGAPHQSDWVRLRPKLTVPMGAAMMEAMRTAEADSAVIEGDLTRVMLRQGIEAWSFVDEKGEAVPISGPAIDEQLDWATAHEVSERANDLYAADFFRPLVLRASRSSANGRTANSTPPKNGTGRKHPKRSKRSSPTPTDSKPSEAPAP